MISNRLQEHWAVFNVRFSRSQELLYFIARRVLGSNEAAKDAVQSCWLTASRNPPEFTYEGAFRSWLIRILIDEALAIRHSKQESSADENLPSAGSRITAIGAEAPIAS
jgi:DNA-directed RNA polymerase specialized sigma24 family protein